MTFVKPVLRPGQLETTTSFRQRLTSFLAPYYQDLYGRKGAYTGAIIGAVSTPLLGSALLRSRLDKELTLCKGNPDCIKRVITKYKTKGTGYKLAGALAGGLLGYGLGRYAGTSLGSVLATIQSQKIADRIYSRSRTLGNLLGGMLKFDDESNSSDPIRKLGSYSSTAGMFAALLNKATLSNILFGAGNLGTVYSTGKELYSRLTGR